MDEALRKIEQVLENERIATRLDKLLPKAAETAKAPEQDMGITHYAKPKVEAPEPQAAKTEAPEPARAEHPSEDDPAAKIGVGAKVFTLDELGASSPAAAAMPEAKIGVGAKEFTLDELGGSQAGSDPLMGQVLKPSTFREMTLDDLSAEEGAAKKE
jgi:hypothetical protein